MPRVWSSQERFRKTVGFGSLRRRNKLAEEERKTHQCEKCGCEAEVVVKEEATKDKPGRGTLVCKICGNEADMILEEI